MKPAVVILAAGKGTRLRSELPKALHTLCARPMVLHLIDTARSLGASKIVVVAGFKHGRVRRTVGGQAQVALQRRQLGSGHAVSQARTALKGFSGPTVVLYCDTPLLSAATLARLCERFEKNKADAALLSVRLADPTGYGRILRRPDGSVEAIVEEKEASDAQKRVREVNVGAYIFRTKKLFRALQSVPLSPVKKEYYLTDAVGILARGGRVEALEAPDAAECLGVNTAVELAALEEHMQNKILARHIEAGVKIRDTRTTVIDAGVRIGAGTVVLPHTVIEAGCVIGRGCTIGPFARLRGASKIADGAVIGNFVEVVRSSVGEKSQVKHLSYLGDTTVGRNVNIGAGTITANFDGKRKHATVIKDGAQIGSGTVLVAPVTVGRNAKTGAGAVVTRGKNVPDRTVFVGVPARKFKG